MFAVGRTVIETVPSQYESPDGLAADEQRTPAKIASRYLRPAPCEVSMRHRAKCVKLSAAPSETVLRRRPCAGQCKRTKLRAADVLSLRAPAKRDRSLLASTVSSKLACPSLSAQGLAQKSVGAVSDRDAGSARSPYCEAARNRSPRRPPTICFFRQSSNLCQSSQPLWPSSNFDRRASACASNWSTSHIPSRGSHRLSRAAPACDRLPATSGSVARPADVQTDVQIRSPEGAAGGTHNHHV
jgi:surface antigen